MTWAANKYTLVADIGGTNSRVALADGTRVLMETVKKYSNTDFSGFDEVLSDFIELNDNVDCKGVCAALAGPVRDGTGTLTNLDWRIDEAMLSDAVKAENVGLFNDLQAQGYAIGNLPEGSVAHVSGQASSDPLATKLVIGLGTGFNAALVLDTNKGRFVPPAEAGHISLPARTSQELEFAKYLANTRGFATIEDMLSGRGLELVYKFLSAQAGSEKTLTGLEVFAAFENGSDLIARQTAEMFVPMLGNVTGNLALLQLPFGGIYFAGSVARAFSKYFDSLGFAEALKDKGRFSDFMDNFSIHVIEDDYAALTGCAAFLASR